MSRLDHPDGRRSEELSCCKHAVGALATRGEGALEAVAAPFTGAMIRSRSRQIACVQMGMAIEVEMDHMDFVPSNWNEDMEDPERAERAPTRRASRRTPKGREKGVKPEERGRRMSGRIARMLYGQSHGFIRVADGREVFFHRKDAAVFNSLVVKDRVDFELIEDPIAGPRAVRVGER